MVFQIVIICMSVESVESIFTIVPPLLRIYSKCFFIVCGGGASFP